MIISFLTTPVQATKEITVINNQSQTILYIEVDESSESLILEWTPQIPNPDEFPWEMFDWRLYKNDNKIDMGYDSWSNNTPVYYDVAPCITVQETYNFTMSFTAYEPGGGEDAAGSGTILVNVLSGTASDQVTIETSSSVTLTLGIGSRDPIILEWICYHPEGCNPSELTLEQNDTWIASDKGQGCTNATPVQYNVSSQLISPGAYNFIMIFSTKEGFIGRGTIFVYVKEDPNKPRDPIDVELDHENPKYFDLKAGDTLIRITGKFNISTGITLSSNVIFRVTVFFNPPNYTVEAFNKSNFISLGLIMDLDINNESAVTTVWLNFSYANLALEQLGIDIDNLKVVYYNLKTNGWIPLEITGLFFSIFFKKKHSEEVLPNLRKF